MDKYEVKYKTDPWANLSKWYYVGSTAEGYRKTQIERYWDSNAFPYRFYAISPCPAAADIDNFTLTDTKLEIPTTYVYQTCNNGVLTAGAEPYMPAQVECPDGSNVKDIDLLNNTVSAMWHCLSIILHRRCASPSTITMEKKRQATSISIM